MPTLPNASTANTNSNANITAETAAAQTAFIAYCTVLINTAISNGLFQIEPYLPGLVTSDYVTTYFTGLGYTVVFPILPRFPENPPFFPADFPEVLPPGYIPWNQEFGASSPPRIQISWVSA